MNLRIGGMNVKSQSCALERCKRDDKRQWKRSMELTAAAVAAAASLGLQLTGQQLGFVDELPAVEDHHGQSHHTGASPERYVHELLTGVLCGGGGVTSGQC